jgi:hypothetical protein
VLVPQSHYIFRTQDLYVLPGKIQIQVVSLSKFANLVLKLTAAMRGIDTADTVFLNDRFNRMEPWYLGIANFDSLGYEDVGTSAIQSGDRIYLEHATFRTLLEVAGEAKDDTGRYRLR